MHVYLRLTPTVALLFAAVPLLAQERVDTPVIWQERGETPALDLSSGARLGRDAGAEFTFGEESANGTLLATQVAGAVSTPVVADPCLTTTCRKVPIRETLTAVGLGNAYTRAILGGFEEAGGVGIGAQVTSGKIVPVVEFRATALTSTRWNYRFDLEAFLPRIGGTANHADIWFSYMARDTDLFVRDPGTGNALETDFSITRRSFQGSFYRDLTDKLQGGVYTQLMNSRARLEPTTATSRVLSYGAFLHYDARDNSVGLTRGIDLYARAASAGGLDHKDTTDYGWTEREFDARGYIPLGGSTTSLLVRSRAQFKSPKQDRGIPFYDLSWLGGRQALRGYDSYRFRGNNLLLLATEVQHTVRALNPTRGIDILGAADAGRTWGGDGGAADLPATALPTLNATFNRSDWHSAFGGGLQYRHSPTLAIRIEVSRGQDRTIAYWSLSRGF